MHNFIHSLDTIPQAWYLIEEKKRGTGTWQVVAEKFMQCFSFKGETKLVIDALQALKRVLFFPYIQEDEEKPLLEQIIKQSVACKWIGSEMDDEI